MHPIKTLDIINWHNSLAESLQVEATAAIENGQLLYLPKLAFVLQEHEKRFLSPDIIEESAKNISFNARLDYLKGARGNEEERQQIQAMLKRFYDHSYALVKALFPAYLPHIQTGQTSFRPVQVSNRKTSYRKDDRRLHVDAFPSNPNQGRRILRIFSNINPHGEDRVWRIGEPFETVALQFLPKISRPLPLSRTLLEKLKITKSYRTEYDHIMLHMHDNMKKNLTYQQQAAQIELRLPPQTSWIVQTDIVSHAALSGQHLLEQTFYLPIEAMIDPDRSPLKILERLTKRNLLT